MKKVVFEKNVIGYARDTIIHNLGYCISNTSNKNILLWARQIEEDFRRLTYPSRLLKTEVSFKNILHSAFERAIQVKCSGGVGEHGIDACLMSNLCEMIAGVKGSVVYTENNAFERIFGSKLNSDVVKNIELFYVGFFKIFNQNIYYVELVKHIKNCDNQTRQGKLDALEYLEK